MVIYRADFCCSIIELVTRNPTMGIPALEDGLFANLLIFDCVYVFRYFCKGNGREGKREEKRQMTY